jgi:hypothetical protein
MIPQSRPVLLLAILSCGSAAMVLGGCGRNTEKASVQDLATRIESAGDDERRNIMRTLSSRGDDAIPEILQAFQKTDKTATQMVLADSVYRMRRSDRKQETLKKMQEMAKDENVRRTIGSYAMDRR